MRVLVLAPHPFYQERGTPIDVLLVLRVLAERPDVELELLTYHEGDDVDLPGLTTHRIRAPRWIRGVRPGFSFKKLVCDAFMFAELMRLVRRRRYDFIHAGEEAAFFGLFLKRYTGIPYAYDLDSSIAQQMVESRTWLSGLAPRLDALEGVLIREALVTFPVCELLVRLCRERGGRKVVPLYDISQLERPRDERSGVLRGELGIEDDEILVLYTGNLEAYQGVELLVDAFRLAAREDPRLRLAVIGGAAPDVAALRRRIEELGLAGRAFAPGPKPFDDLHLYLSDADILACPRIRGVNTPMKVFPYLHSGRPVLVTDLPTHTQILGPDVARIAPATPSGYAAGMLALAADSEERAALGAAGRAFVEENHTYEAHRRRLNAAYDWIADRLAGPDHARGGATAPGSRAGKRVRAPSSARAADAATADRPPASPRMESGSAVS